jgi:hypothetical protein
MTRMTDFKFVFKEDDGRDLCDLIVDINENYTGIVNMEYSHNDENTVYLVDGCTININNYTEFVLQFTTGTSCIYYFDKSKNNYFQLSKNKFIINFVFEECEVLRKEISIDSNETGAQIYKQLDHFYHWCCYFIEN